MPPRCFWREGESGAHSRSLVFSRPRSSTRYGSRINLLPKKSLLQHSLRCFTTRDFQRCWFGQQFLATLAVGLIWPDSAAVYLKLTLLIAAGRLVIADLRRVQGVAITGFGAFWFVYAWWISRLPGPHPNGLLFSGLTFGTVLFLAWI